MRLSRRIDPVERELKARAEALGIPAVVVQWIRMGELDDQLQAGRLRFTTPQRQAEVEGLAAWYYEALDSANRAAAQEANARDLARRDGLPW